MSSYGSWEEFLPEIHLLQDRVLADKVIGVYEEARQIGGWNSIDEVAELPFAIAYPEFRMSLREHIRLVVQLCGQGFDVLQGKMADMPPMRYDVLIAGALLHDVAKIFAFSKDPDGAFVMSTHEKLLRHCFSGVGLAMKHDLPEEIVHMIAYHSEEGIGKFRTPEAVLLNKMDYLAFDILKAYSGMNQMH